MQIHFTVEIFHVNILISLIRMKLQSKGNSQIPNIMLQTAGKCIILKENVMKYWKMH